MPKGALVYNGLVDFMKRIYKIYDYQEVITPQVLDVDLWHTSGHYEKYKENMYFTHIDEREFALKPMNCPCHMLMFSHHRYSYRDLPLRFADFGRLHRYEKSGVVAGLTRVRTFCQDDAHIFIQFDGIQKEIATLMEMFFIGYEHFGFKKIKIGLSTRPEMRVGSDDTWDRAEAALKAALDASGKEYFVNEGDGAFYGPKIDIQVADALGRYFQLGTIQLDFQLPERFDLKFTNQSGEMERPVVIHRALLGSLERFIGVYLEHVGGAFPFWLSPEQAVIIPIKNELHLEAAKKLEKQLKAQGFRVRVDDRNESMGLKTRQAQTGKIPYMLVLGDQEIEAGTVAVRKYGEMKSEVMPQADLMNHFQKLDLEKMPAPLRG
jgi:threonyl-tRNA synthetase